MKLSRRAFLGGAAASVGLPLLEAMLRPDGLSLAHALGGDDKLAQRLLFYYIPNGIHMAAWTPKKEGAGYDLPPILAPLEKVKDQVSVLTGLANLPAKPDGPGDHAAGTGSFLTAMHCKKTAGADIRNGISVDQVAANALGDLTPLRSLQLGMEGGANVGSCDSGYSCIYSRNISWSGPKTVLPKLTNPQLVYERLFAGLNSTLSKKEAARRRIYRKSVLDAVLGDAKRLHARLGMTDRFKLDEYMNSVREVEKRLDKLGQSATCEVPGAPEKPKNFIEKLDLMTEMMVLAMRCDRTRFITFMLGNAGSNRSYAFIGVPGAHHQISHHQDKQENFDKLQKIDIWEVTQLAMLLEKMAAIPEGDGTLLDNCLVMAHSDSSFAQTHDVRGLPVMTAGRAGGKLRTGLHVAGNGDPITRVGLTMQHLVGEPVASWGTGGMAVSNPITEIMS